MFACPRDNGANALQLRFREGTSSKFDPDANHAFTEWRFYIAPMRLPAQGISDRRTAPAAVSRNFIFAMGPVMPLRLPIFITLHLPMGGDQSSHSVKRKSNANPSLAEARTLGRGLRRDRSGDSRFLATRVARRQRVPINLPRIAPKPPSSRHLCHSVLRRPRGTPNRRRLPSSEPSSPPTRGAISW